jgi:hypothetical protein
MIEAFHHKGAHIRRRVAWLKSLASTLTLGSGGSGGREGRCSRPDEEEQTMCPACLSTMMLIAASAAPTGGLAALAARRLGARSAEEGRDRAASSNGGSDGRTELLAKEKEFSRARDALSAERRRLPMVRVDKEYVFDGSDGSVALRDLFAGRRQLIVYHFMFDPTWEAGCKSCSFIADNFEGGLIHVRARDTSFVVISRAPLSTLDAFKKRMGWTFTWL